MNSIEKFMQGNTIHMILGILIFLAAVGIVILIYRYVTRKLTKRASRTKSQLDDFIIEVMKMPFLLLLIWIMFRIFSQTVFFDTRYFSGMNHIIEILMIITVGWILIKGTRVLFYYLENKLDTEAKNNYRARSSLTKMKIFQRMIVALIIVVVVALCLMTFDKIRAVGVSLLTSAGIAGIIVGFAAQKSLGMMLAGIQLAITQPIRLDDQVIVEGETGSVEEIKLTYVVINLWDERRMILPVNYFLENPFQNLTINSSRLLGTVYLYVDYMMPLDVLRKELQKILENSPKWDKRVANLQVTDMKPNYMELRVLLSSADSGSKWDLTVEVREKLVKFIQDNYPQYFVKNRIADESPENGSGNRSKGGHGLLGGRNPQDEGSGQNEQNGGSEQNGQNGQNEGQQA